MAALWIGLIVAVLGISAGPPAYADIYTWTDEQGVKHYSNSPPPDESSAVERRSEVAHDAQSHQQRLAEDEASHRAYQEAEALRLREERQMDLLRQQQAAREVAAEAARRAEAAAQQAAEAARKAESAPSGYILVPPRYPRPRPLPNRPPVYRPFPHEPHRRHSDSTHQPRPPSGYR